MKAYKLSPSKFYIIAKRKIINFINAFGLINTVLLHQYKNTNIHRGKSKYIFKAYAFLKNLIFDFFCSKAYKNYEQLLYMSLKCKLELEVCVKVL